jgi:hypothetical protein
MVFIQTVDPKAENIDLIIKAQNFVNDSISYLEKASQARPHHSTSRAGHGRPHAGRAGGAMGHFDEDSLSLMHEEGMCEECDEVRREQFQSADSGMPMAPSTATGTAVLREKFYKLYDSGIVADRYITKSADGRHHYISGVISDDSIDRDGDRMTLRALKMMEEDINSGITLFQDHKHELENSLGYPVHTEIKRNADGINQLVGTFQLDDPEVNPKVASLLSKIDAGMRVGLSIGGDMGEHSFENSEGKRVRAIDGVKLYEISAVGIPSNSNSYVLGHFLKGWRMN